MQAAKLFGWVDKPTSEPGFWIPSPDFADCGLRSVCCHLLHWKLSYTRGTGVCECIWQIHMYLLSAATCPTNWLTFRRLKPGCPLCATWSQFDLNVWHFHLAFPGHISYQALNWGFLPVHGILKSPGFKGQLHGFTTPVCVCVVSLSQWQLECNGNNCNLLATFCPEAQDHFTLAGFTFNTLKEAPKKKRNIVFLN